MKAHSHGELGFTLLELLAAIVVFGVIGMMLSQGFLFGLDATRLTADAKNGDLLATDTALRRVVAFADPGIYPEPATLRGTAVSLALTTELPSGGTGPAQRADAVLLASAGRLILHWRPHRHAESFGPGPAWTDTVLADEVERIEFAYFGGPGGWSSSWTGDRLPSLVRITLGFAVGGGRHWPPLLVAPVREPIEE